jgi:serine/threonine protein kinase
MGICFSGPALPPVNIKEVDLTHFELLKVVGKGGFGKVNAIEHRGDKQLYAMKTMDKENFVGKKSLTKTLWIERKVMAMFRSNFLVHVHWAFQDEYNLYFIMHFMRGGDMRYHIEQHGKMSESDCRFYAAEILLALEEMSTYRIVYRDLKPDNIMLDEEGHVRVSDFGLCTILTEEYGFMTAGLSGTSGYMAPEVLARKKYNTSQDVWSFGIVLFEFLHLHRPFKDGNEVSTVEPAYADLSAECIDLLNGLLTKDPAARLGCGPSAWKAVKAHRWFRSINWEDAKERKLKPPFVPEPDIAHCSAIFDLEDQFFTDNRKRRKLTSEEQTLFEGFDYRTQQDEEGGFKHAKNLNEDLSNSKPKMRKARTTPSGSPYISLVRMSPSESPIAVDFDDGGSVRPSISANSMFGMLTPSRTASFTPLRERYDPTKEPQLLELIEFLE